MDEMTGHLSYVDKLNQVIEFLNETTVNVIDVNDSLESKVDKVTGKDLSTNDYSNTDKTEVGKVKDKADTSYVDGKVETLTSQLADIASQVGVSTENKYSYSYNANGDIQTVTEKSKTDVVISTTTYTYKANGDVDTSVKVSGTQTLTTQYIYDANGNLTDTVSTKS